MLPKCFRFDLTGNAATPAATGGGSPNPPVPEVPTPRPWVPAPPARPKPHGQADPRAQENRENGYALPAQGERPPGNGQEMDPWLKAAAGLPADAARTAIAPVWRAAFGNASPTAGEWAILAAILTDGVPLDLVLGVIRECRDRRMVFGSIRAAWTVRHSNGLAADDDPFTGVIA